MRSKYTDEYRKQAIELAESMKSVKGAANQLGIADTLIHTWRKKFEGEKKESLNLNSSEKEELVKLRKENSELKKVNYILKSAAAFFSQDHLK